MTLILPFVSILALAGLAWLAGKASRSAPCPICFGVAGTWLWMLAARFAGFQIDATILAMLLGASVVGVAGQLEGRLAQGRPPLLWKTLTLPIGFVVAYALVAEHWTVAVIAALALILLGVTFVLPRRFAGSDQAVVKKLEQEMKKCC